MNIKLLSGDIAPDFCLPGVNNNCEEKLYCSQNLLKSTKKGIILYFYPKDNTSGCTTEAKDFAKYKEYIQKLGYSIVGISKDSIDSHCKFIQKHNISIPLLSDTTTEVIKQYGVWGKKKMYEKIKEGIIRSTFIIGKD